MSPDNKTALVNILKQSDTKVGMCGDGINDCGALKNADAGISLCYSDASISAPFSS